MHVIFREGSANNHLCRGMILICQAPNDTAVLRPLYPPSVVLSTQDHETALSKPQGQQRAWGPSLLATQRMPRQDHGDTHGHGAHEGRTNHRSTPPVRKCATRPLLIIISPVHTSQLPKTKCSRKCKKEKTRPLENLFVSLTRFFLLERRRRESMLPPRQRHVVDGGGGCRCLLLDDSCIG
jgi:hypothetical protein